MGFFAYSDFGDSDSGLITSLFYIPNPISFLACIIKASDYRERSFTLSYKKQNILIYKVIAPVAHFTVAWPRKLLKGSSFEQDEQVKSLFK